MTAELTERSIQRALHFALRSSAHVMLPNYTPAGWFEMDLCVITKHFRLVEYEIKLSRSDILADAKKEMVRFDFERHVPYSNQPQNKREMTRRGDLRGPSRFIYVIPKDLLRSVVDAIPDWAGIYVASTNGVYVWVRQHRAAQQLHRHGVDRRLPQNMMRSAYYRFWNERRVISEEPDGTDDEAAT